MTYENAPQTRLLATHCAVCRRPLCDAKSVELGIGPECRRRHGFDTQVSEEARVRANRLVWEVAVDRSPTTILASVTELRLLGLTKLADVLLDRAAVVRVVEVEMTQRLQVHTPYRADVVEAMRHIPGRWWNSEHKVNTFPVTQRRAIWNLLLKAFPGALGIGPKGAFVVEAKPAQDHNEPGQMEANEP